MPRIKAALALLVTAVFCIGFNAMRYPAVWEMLAASGPSSADSTAQTTASAPKKSNENLPVPAASILGSGSEAGKRSDASTKREEKPGSTGKKADKQGSAKGKSSENQKPEKSQPKPGKGPSAAKAKKPESKVPESEPSKRAEASESDHDQGSGSDYGSGPEQSTVAKTGSSDDLGSSSIPPYYGGDSSSYGATDEKKAEKSNGYSSSDSKPSEADKTNCNNGLCKMPGSDFLGSQSSASRDAASAGIGSSSPVEMSAEPRYGSSAAANSASPYGAPSGGTTYGTDGVTAMVPVDRSSKPESHNSSLYRPSTTSDNSAKPQATRLPPVDETGSTDPDPYAAPPAGPLPIYPVTKPKN